MKASHKTKSKVPERLFHRAGALLLFVLALNLSLNAQNITVRDRQGRYLLPLGIKGNTRFRENYG